MYDLATYAYSFGSAEVFDKFEVRKLREILADVGLETQVLNRASGASKG